MSDTAGAYPLSREDPSAGTLSSVRSLGAMKKILSHEFAVFAQPGALIAMLLVLLMMGVGAAAMAIAARGWPF